MHSNSYQYSQDRSAGIHSRPPDTENMFKPGAVYQLKQVGGLNDGRVFYIDSTVNLKNTTKEHKNLQNIYTYGYIQALYKEDLKFEVMIIERRTRLFMCEQLVRDLLRMGKQTGAHLVNLAPVCRLYLNPQVM